MLDNGQEAIFLPGRGKEFISSHRYQEEVGKDFKRITLYLCTATDFYHSQTVGLDWDAPDIEDEDYPTHEQGGGASAKRLKIDLVSKSEDNEKSVMEEMDRQIKQDEVAMELQRQLLEESDVVATGAELTDSSTEIAFEDEHSNGMKRNKMETKSADGFTSPTSVIQELGKRVDRNSNFFIKTNAISQNS